MMTPYAIEILIHCHVSIAPHPQRFDPAFSYEIDGLLTNGLIERAENNGFVTTERGKAHLEQLCRTALPVKAWLCADGTTVVCDEPQSPARMGG